MTPPSRLLRFLALSLAAIISPATAAGDRNLMPIGAASVDITPDYPIRLSGYLARKTESEGVVQRIYAKALAIGSDTAGPALVLALDNCALPAALRTELLERLRRHGVTSERLAVSVTHTHSAPKLAGALDNIFGADIPSEQQARIERYTRELLDHLEQVAIAALRDRQPRQLAFGRTQVGFAANRRIKNGPVDHDLPVLVARDADGKVRAVMTNYACHCTTLGPEPNAICGDWAGYANEYLEQQYAGAVALMLIGCGADANPAPRPGVELAQQHGRSLADAVRTRIAEPLTPVTGRLECRTTEIALPFDRLPTKEEWTALAAKDDPTGYHARKNLARLERGESLPTALPYLVQAWNFGTELALVFLPGEVVAEYVLRLKAELDPARLWVTAYTNAVPCYIPSRNVWRLGGYEGRGAMIYYDLPTRLAEDTEDRIIAAVHQLVPRSFVRDPK